MSNAAKTIELPEGFQAFAEERVRSGQAGSVEEVALEAFREKQSAALHEALDIGIAQLDAGLGVETTPDELMDEICAEIGLEP